MKKRNLTQLSESSFNQDSEFPAVKTKAAAGPSSRRPSSATQTLKRDGLFSHEKKNTAEQKALFDAAIPEGLSLSAAKGKGDCFYDSFAQGLNESLGTDEHTLGSLRALCHSYVVDLDRRCAGNPEHPDNWIGKTLKGPLYQQYLANVRYTVEEREAGEGLGDDKLAIWGEQHIDGRILCQKLGVKLHVIEVRDNPDDLTNETQKFILSHNLEDGNGLKNVNGDEIYWNDKKIIHIAVCNLHYVPILSNTVKQAITADAVHVQPLVYSHDDAPIRGEKMKTLRNVENIKDLRPSGANVPPHRNTEAESITIRRPVSLHRLAEILFRSRVILNSVGTKHFADFARRYSLNVRNGLHLLKKVKGHYDPELHFRSRDFFDILTQVGELESYGNLLEEGYLSIYDQLLQILARWRVNQWIIGNQDFILWCHRRREYLPTLLTQYAGNSVLLSGDMVEQTLPAVDFLWLVELVGPTDEEQVAIEINRISFKISRPEYSRALLKFSAQLDQMDTFKAIISPLGEDSIESVLQFAQKRKSVFEDLLAGRTNQILDRYRQSNPQADAIITALLDENRGLLVRLMNLRNHQKVLRKQAALDVFAPLIQQLQTLKSLIIPLDTMKILEVLQFFKANQNFFSALAFNYNAFHPAFRSYVDANPQAKDFIEKLRTHAQSLRMLLQTQDIRIVLTDPQAKEYFRPLVNDLSAEFFNERLQFLVCLSGINDQWQQRDKAVVWLVTFIEKYRDVMRHLVADKKECRSWIKHHPEFQSIASEFRNGLIQCVEGPVKLSEESFAMDCKTGDVRGCVDVRPGKVRTYVPILTCFLEALGDLTEHGTVNHTAKDVLLFNFLSHRQNHALLQFFYDRYQTIQPVLEAFLFHQNNRVDPEVPIFDPAVFRDQSNHQVSDTLHSKLKQKALEPKRLRFDFQEPQNRVNENTENQKLVPVAVTLR